MTHFEVRDGQVAETDDPAGALARGASLIWISLEDPDPEEVVAQARLLGMNPALVTDARAEHRRPRLLEHGKARAVVLLPAAYDDAAEDVRLGGLVVLTDGPAVLTVARECSTDLSGVRRALDTRSTPDTLLQAVVRQVIEDYDPVIDGLDDDVEQVEVQVFSDDDSSHARRIYLLKRESLELHRAVSPLVDVVRELDCGGGLYERLLRVAEHVERLDALLDGVLDADLAQVGVRQNEDQRRISAWAAIALVPTVVGGIYGMNFENMPELSWRFGYPAALTLVLVCCLALYLGFRRNDWL